MGNKDVKFVGLAIVLIIFMIAAAGCTQSTPTPAATPTPAPQPTSQTITDMYGYTVTVPTKIDRIVDGWPAHNEVLAMLGASEQDRRDEHGRPGVALVREDRAQHHQDTCTGERLDHKHRDGAAVQSRPGHPVHGLQRFRRPAEAERHTGRHTDLPQLRRPQEMFPDHRDHPRAERAGEGRAVHHIISTGSSQC